MNPKTYFSPYQLTWLADQSRIKIWEKSRRIGATYVQAYEDVRDIVKRAVKKVWFSSADESAAREYIEYCEFWTRVFDTAAKPAGYTVLEDEKDIKVHTIEYPWGAKIHGLSSNPRAFRSKEGKIVLDEFAHHEDQKKLWTAARPCITLGYPLRILSTHNGAQCLFAQFIDKIKKKKLDWGHHRTPIQVAAREGLVARALRKRSVTEEEIEAWLKTEEADCADEITWLQEYCCEVIDETTAFLPYELIIKCEAHGMERPLDQFEGDLYVGFDVARKKHFSVIWGFEKLGMHRYTRFVKTFRNAPFKEQKDFLYQVLQHPRLRRCCIDNTGIGMQMAEEAAADFGKYRVEGVTFTSRVKEELAYALRTQFEDVMVHIPDEELIRNDLHSVKRITTTSGNIRFDVENSTASDGHADHFWALALANHAASGSVVTSIPRIAVRRPRESRSLLRGF